MGNMGLRKDQVRIGRIQQENEPVIWWGKFASKRLAKSNNEPGLCRILDADSKSGTTIGGRLNLGRDGEEPAFVPAATEAGQQRMTYSNP